MIILRAVKRRLGLGNRPEVPERQRVHSFRGEVKGYEHTPKELAARDRQVELYTVGDTVADIYIVIAAYVIGRYMILNGILALYQRSSRFVRSMVQGVKETLVNVWRSITGGGRGRGGVYA